GSPWYWRSSSRSAILKSAVTGGPTSLRARVRPTRREAAGDRCCQRPPATPKPWPESPPLPGTLTASACAPLPPPPTESAQGYPLKRPIPAPGLDLNHAHTTTWDSSVSVASRGPRKRSDFCGSHIVSLTVRSAPRPARCPLREGDEDASENTVVGCGSSVAAGPEPREAEEEPPHDFHNTTGP